MKKRKNTWKVGIEDLGSEVGVELKRKEKRADSDKRGVGRI